MGPYFCDCSQIADDAEKTACEGAVAKIPNWILESDVAGQKQICADKKGSWKPWVPLSAEMEGKQYGFTPTFYYENPDQFCKCCPSGQYQEDARMPTCKECPTGKITEDHCSAGCTSCPAGYYDSENECIGCPAGWQQSMEGADRCLQCAIGMYQSLEAELVCNECVSGYYAEVTAMTKCKYCPAGWYQNEQDHNADCKECELGRYNNFAANDHCNRCPNGKYEDNVRSTACKDIPNGAGACGEGPPGPCNNEGE